MNQNNPKMGRPPKSPEVRRVRCGDLTLPKWLHTWLMSQPDPAGHIIEKIIIEKFDLIPPKE